MPNKQLVGLTDILDRGRQKYNEAVRTYYDTDKDGVPLINGLLKSVFDPTGGKAKLLSYIGDKWITFAYEDPIPTNLLYYDTNSDKIISKVPIEGTSAKFDSIQSDNISTDNIVAPSGRIDTLTVNILNVVNKINQTLTEQLNIADNTIQLNSNLADDADPDALGLNYSGIVINRGKYVDARLVWDETKNRWLLEVPNDTNDPAKRLELFGIYDDINRSVIINNSNGIVFSESSRPKNPGIFIKADNYYPGIYWNNDIGRYCVRYKDSRFELVGIDIVNPGRKLVLNNSTGIQVNNYTDTLPSLDFIAKNTDNSDKSKGSLVYDHNKDRFMISTKNSTFVIRDIYELNPFGDTWYYQTQLNAGEKNIVLPADKPLMNSDKDLTMVFIDGIIQRPDSYTIQNSDRIVLNSALSAPSQILVYHHAFLHTNYRLPEKSLAQKVTGVSGNEIIFAHSSNIVLGAPTGMVFKNNNLLHDGVDFTFERISDTQLKVKFVTPLITSDVIIIYPFMTPNIWLRGNNALIFDSQLANPDSTVEGSAHIIFRRGNNNPAGIRWNEENNNLEFDNGTGIWETFNGTSTKIDNQRFKIDTNTTTINLENFFARNGINPSIHKHLNLMVLKNGFFQDNPEDYKLVGKQLIFNTSLNIGDIVWVYMGQSFIKSQNHISNKKALIIVPTDTKDIQFTNGFMYEPGVDMLNIFVNGILTEKNIDYIEVDEKTVRFNYKIEAGTIIQAYVPTITALFKHSKKVFEFDITDSNDFLNTDKSNCFISVNRGTTFPAAIKWDEVSDKWYLSNGDGVYHKILTSAEYEDKQYTQFKEYKNHTGHTISIADLVGNPTKILVYKNGTLLPNSKYSLTEKIITFTDQLQSTDIISVLCYTSGEIVYIKDYGKSENIKFTKQLVNEDIVLIDLAGIYDIVPIMNIYINGVLLHESRYTAKLVTGNSKLRIQFVKPYSGELSVTVMPSKSTHTIISGNENIILFKNHQGENYDDTKPIGNFSIYKDRGPKLKPAYIKWDEVENVFTFATGGNTEYIIPKVVFANNTFTPDNIDEEILLINKTTGKLHGYYNRKWNQLT